MRPRATRFHGHPDDWPDDEWAVWKRRNRRRAARSHSPATSVLTSTPATRHDEPVFYGHPDDWTDEEWAAWKSLNPGPITRIVTEMQPERQQSRWSRFRAWLAVV